MPEDALQVGDRVKLYGGYDDWPAWLGGAPWWLGGDGRKNHLGTVVDFIPGTGPEPDAVVQTDEWVRLGSVRSNILVLHLRFEGATWGVTETVHIELCRLMPERKAWPDRPVGIHAESHATYEKISGA